MGLTADLRWGNLCVEINNIENDGITALFGPSGIGKTSLLRIIAGLDRGQQGTLVKYDESVWQSDDVFVPPHLRGIGYVFQDARLLPHLTVIENIEFAWKRRFGDNGPSPDKACELLQIGQLQQRSVQSLSGGEQQRVAIARSLASAPRLLLMDEPLAALDATARDHILSLLESLHREIHIPVIYVSHQLEEVVRLADHVLLLDHNGEQTHGPIENLSTDPTLPLAQLQGSASILSGTVCEHDEFHLSQVLVGKSTRLWASGRRLDIGQAVRLRIPVSAVSIATTAPEHSSILNVLPVQVELIHPLDDARALVRLTTSDTALLAAITQRSIYELGLEPGQHVYAQIKGVALLTDYGDSP
ncbi:MAG: molybdenum ABC transporter ATP-binding protein [Pseudomonadales bacterium]